VARSNDRASPALFSPLFLCVPQRYLTSFDSSTLLLEPPCRTASIQPIFLCLPHLASSHLNASTSYRLTSRGFPFLDSCVLLSSSLTLRICLELTRGSHPLASRCRDLAHVYVSGGGLSNSLVKSDCEAVRNTVWFVVEAPNCHHNDPIVKYCRSSINRNIMM
jgi:hypothetical protein